MTNHFDIAQQVFLDSSDLTISEMQTVLEEILTRQIDFADFYLEDSYSESWFLEKSIVKDAGFHIDCGVGVRAISGEKTGFAYSNDIDLKSLSVAAHMARNIAQDKGNRRVQVSSYVKGLQLYPILNPLETLSAEEKVDLLKKIDQIARKEDARVTRVMASLSGSYRVVFIMASDGTLAADVRPLVHLSVKVIVEDKDKQEVGCYGGGERGGYACFLKKGVVAFYAKEAVRQALVNLEALSVPAGLMPVILGPGWPGVLLHEAVGHGLEGDVNRKKTSAFFDRMGEKVASPVCTVVDDGTIKRRRGSLNIDDEGVPTQYNVLVEKGILRGFLHDKLNGRLMGVQSTGNGRRESFASIPIPRMTNTYMLPGENDPAEIIASVDRGLYAVNFSGGQVDTTSGKFVFSTSEAYLIEKGKVSYPVKGATLIGNGPDVLTKVSMVGNDLALDSGVGSCGRDGQTVSVGVGQPTLKIDELTVGGMV